MVPGRNSGSSRQDPSVEPGRSGTSRLPQVAGGGCVVGPQGCRVAWRGGVANASARNEGFGHSFGPHRVHRSPVRDAHSGTPDTPPPYPVDRGRSVCMVHLGPLCGES